MRLEIHRLAERFQRLSGRHGRLGLVGQIAHQRLQLRQVAGVAHDFAVARYDQAGPQGLQAIQHRRPGARVAVEAVGCRVHDEITADQDALLRQPDIRIARGIAFAGVTDLDAAPAAAQHQLLLEGHGGRRHPAGLDFLQEHVRVLHQVFKFPQLVVCERRAIGPDAALQAFRQQLHLLGDGNPVLLDVVHGRAEHRFACKTVADDFQRRPGLEVAVTAKVVVTVPMRDDEVAHGQVGNGANLRDQAIGQQGRAVAVHHHDVIVVDDDGAVAHDRLPRRHGSDRDVDAIGDAVQPQLEGIGLRRRIRARHRDAVKNRQQQQSPAQPAVPRSGFRGMFSHCTPCPAPAVGFLASRPQA